MKHIIAICNRKGGVAKTTTAHALGAGLTLKGYKTLLVDLDSQCNLSQAVGADLTKGNAWELIRGQIVAKEAVRPVSEKLYIMPGSPALATADIDIKDTGREYKLKEALVNLLPAFDYCVIDCPPSLGILSVNALTAADRLIIPVQADYFSLTGLEDLQNILKQVKKYTNPAIVTSGILFTRHNPRTVFTRELDEVITDTAKSLETKVFDARIREAVAVKEAQAVRKDIFTYAPKSNVADDYGAFVDEALKSF